MKRKHLGITLAIAFALLLAGLGYWRYRTSGFSWSAFAAQLGGLDWTWLTLAFIGILATYVVRMLRWEIMLRPLTAHTSKPRILAATCIGFTAVVLFGRAGEPVRPYLIAKKEGVSFSSQIAAWLVERILDLMMILVIFGVALSQVSRTGIRPSPAFETTLVATGYVAGFTGLVCLCVLIALRQFRGRVRERLLEALGFLPDALHYRVEQFLAAFEEGMQSTRNASFIWQLVGYTVLEWLMVVAAFYCVFQAFPATMDFDTGDVIICMGFIALGSAIQIPGVGGGMQIAAALVLTQFYGLTLEVASSVALVLWVVSFVSIVPIGLALAFHEGIKWRNLKEITKETSGYGL